MGNPVAVVKQKQYCRVEGNDKCILSMSSSFEGIPYSDTFGVEVRWVARRNGSSDIQVDVGLFVNFRKSTLLKNQIKSGTISETKNVHLRLFDAAVKACSASSGRGTDEDSIEIDDDAITEQQKKEVTSFSTNSDLLSILSSVSSNSRFMLVGAAVFATILLFGRRGATLQPHDVALLHERIDNLEAEIRSLTKSIDTLVTQLNRKR